MALTKIWAGSSQTDATTTAGDYSVADNWEPISLVNATYRWLASGSGSNEYYLDLAGGGDPGIAEPANVQEVVSGVRTNMTADTAGSLAAGEWDYADNDTLGYSTIYVRLTGSTDPDASDTKHVTMTAIPATGDDVVIPAQSSQDISSGLKQSGVAIADFIVASGYTGTIGTDEDYLEIDPNRFEYHGGGIAYIDIGSANINALITDSGQAATGLYGINLLGSNIAKVSVEGGQVAIAPRAGDTSTVADVQAKGTNVFVSEGVALTNFYSHQGENTVACAATKVECFGGVLTTTGSGVITTMNANGGQVIHGSTGTLGTLNINSSSGSVDLRGNRLSRTVTTVNHDSGSLSVGSEFVTITTYNEGPNLTGDYTISVTPDV